MGYRSNVCAEVLEQLSHRTFCDDGNSLESSLSNMVTAIHERFVSTGNGTGMAEELNFKFKLS